MNESREITPVDKLRLRCGYVVDGRPCREMVAKPWQRCEHHKGLK